MRVVILAAGVGSRLKPITETKPKALTKVCGIPILEYQLKAYKKAGIKEENITVVVGYKGEKIEKFIKSNFPKVSILKNEEYSQTNNMYSLYLFLEKNIQKIDDYLLISNGDCIYENSILEKLVTEDVRNLIVCDTSTYLDESMKIKVNTIEKNIIEISKNIPKDEAFAVSIDLYKFSKNTAEKLYSLIKENYIRKQILDKWTELAINDLLQIEKIYPLDIAGKKWIEIDNMEDLLMAEKIFCNFSYKNKKAFILDLDGTVYIGKKVFQSAIKFINENRNFFDFYFMTNNTSVSPDEYVKKLTEIGLENIKPNSILSPFFPLVEFLNQNNIKNIYCLCTESFKKALKKKGINVLEENNLENVEAVVVGFDKELEYKKLETASILLKDNSIKFLLTHPDYVCPTEKGNIPDAGAISKVLEITTGRKPDRIFGKPFIDILKPILKNYSPEDIVLVGDRLYTDKALAEKANIEFILVLTGETNREDVENEEKFPSLILKELGELQCV